MEAIAWLIGGFLAGALARDALARHGVPAEEDPPPPGAAPAERQELVGEIDRRRADATLERPLLVATFDIDDFHQ